VTAPPRPSPSSWCSQLRSHLPPNSRLQFPADTSRPFQSSCPHRRTAGWSRRSDPRDRHHSTRTRPPDPVYIRRAVWWHRTGRTPRRCTASGSPDGNRRLRTDCIGCSMCM